VGNGDPPISRLSFLPALLIISLNRVVYLLPLSLCSQARRVGWEETSNMTLFLGIRCVRLLLIRLPAARNMAVSHDRGSAHCVRWGGGGVRWVSSYAGGGRRGASLLRLLGSVVSRGGCNDRKRRRVRTDYLCRRKKSRTGVVSQET